jgi:hypothetical protein
MWPSGVCNNPSATNAAPLVYLKIKVSDYKRTVKVY